VKILLVNDYAVPFGGAEIQLLALRRVLRERGHDVRLFASSARPDGHRGEQDYECFGTLSRFRTLLQSMNPFAFLALRRALADFRPDVVHVTLFLTQLSPLVLLALRKVPTLYYAVWYRSICPLGTKLLPSGESCRSPAGVICYRAGCLPRRDWLPLMAQMKLWYHWRGTFDCVVANSHYVKRRLEADGIDVAAVVWPGATTGDSRAQLASTPTAVAAARLTREKGIDVLLHAFAGVIQQIPEARLLIAGDGPERAALVQLARELGVSSSVEFEGHTVRPELERHFAGSWVQVVPSRWEEPFGLAAAEAMQRGTAVIASDTGGLSELIQHGVTGLLVPPGDVDQLSRALSRVLSDHGLAERLGRAGRKYARATLDESTSADQFLKLYAALCATSPVATSAGASS
jgi:glycosyltransferase involved in cell wall biosynthesis